MARFAESSVAILLLIIIINLHLPIQTSAAVFGNETDLQALQDFKSRVTDDPYNLLGSWNDSVHFCQWRGVTCDLRDQRIIELNLSGMRFAGSLTPYMGNLTLLQNLNLAESFFRGSIPLEFSQLTMLQNLNVSSNFLEGKIPSNLSAFSNLVNLSLDHNFLNERIPLELGSLSGLVRLYLSNNNLTGNLPASLGNLSFIQELDVSYNNLDAEIPQEVGKLKSLTRFVGGLNSFSGEFPCAVYNLSSLQHLSLTSNNFYGTMRPDVGMAFPNIRRLWLGGNRFTGNIPVSLSNASELFQLDLGSNELTGSIPLSFGRLQSLTSLLLGANKLGNGAAGDLNFLAALVNCSSLRTLDFPLNQFGGEIPPTIANFSTRLTWLNFRGNMINGSIPPSIANLVGLTTLGMGFNSLSGNIPDSLGRLTNLRQLYLRYNYFTGIIPFSLGNLTQILNLRLENNRLEGSLPSSFGNFKALEEIDLSQNSLSGAIPSQLIGLSSLSKLLNLSHNSFTGSLPHEVENLEDLVAFDVSHNRLTGVIPSSLGFCLALEELFLQSNSFQGAIPDLSRLEGLQYLNLSGNNLEGRIPQYLVNLTSLLSVDLSSNNLEGEVPADGVFKNPSAIEVQGNPKLCGGIPQLDLHQCPAKQRQHNSKTHVVIKVVVVTIVVTTCLATVIAFCLKKAKGKGGSSRSLGHFHQQCTYKELYDATGGFSPTNLIGAGNFGTVYRGVIGPSESGVAIKVLNLEKQGAAKSFTAECEALRSIRHRNLVKILTVCSSTDFQGKDFKALIYQFLQNGSLEKWLYPEEESQSRSLSLVQRLNIAIDVASALQYLHHQCHTPVVHCDLKPSNVLLDDELTAHLSDFGLARLLSKFNRGSNLEQFSSFGIRGTIGYTPPEYGIGGAASTQGDVYSYGILLLELFTGRKPVGESFRDSFNLHNFVKSVLQGQQLNDFSQSKRQKEDLSNKLFCWSSLRSEENECLVTILEVGVACSAEHPRDRMKMTVVLNELVLVRERFLGISAYCDPQDSSLSCDSMKFVAPR